jgi:hypothetical protein
MRRCMQRALQFTDARAGTHREGGAVRDVAAAARVDRAALCAVIAAIHQVGARAPGTQNQQLPVCCSCLKIFLMAPAPDNTCCSHKCLLPWERGGGERFVLEVLSGRDEHSYGRLLSLFGPAGVSVEHNPMQTPRLPSGTAVTTASLQDQFCSGFASHGHAALPRCAAPW